MSLKDRYLTDCWKELRNDGSDHALAIFKAKVDALAATGLLCEAEQELWMRRSASCPGHDDEGGRVWCAYCGNLTQESNASTEPTGSKG
jgi:hypothetical protein